MGKFLSLLYTSVTLVPSDDLVTDERVASRVCAFYKEPMRWIFLLAMMGMTTAHAEPCGTPDDCGIQSTVIPDFSLSDVNPNSTTHGTERNRDEFLGSVLVVYFSQAT